VPPHALEKLLAAQHDAAMVRELLQQLELAPGQLDLAPAATDSALRRVHDQVAHAHERPVRRGNTTQKGTQARYQLVEVERLDHVVVRAGLEPGDAILHLVPSREDADRRLDVALAQPRGDGHAGEVGHHDVEHYHLRAQLLDELQRAPAAIGHLHREALEAQRALEGYADLLVVIHDENEGALL